MSERLEKNRLDQFYYNLSVNIVIQIVSSYRDPQLQESKNIISICLIYEKKNSKYLLIKLILHNLEPNINDSL